jgi:hypothetical protein
VRDLLVLLPVRGRPANLARFREAFAATATRGTDLLVIMDADDDSYNGQLGPGSDVTAMICDRMPTGPKVNAAAAKHAGSYSALMFMGDDNVPVTPGWDALLLEACAHSGMAFANDLSGHAGLLPCSAMMTSDIVQALGWMALPSVSHFFMDNVWLELGQRAGCLTYLPGVVIDHRHPVWGKAASDELYDTARPLYWEHDEAAFSAWKAGQMAADVETVKGLLR